MFYFYFILFYLILLYPFLRVCVYQHLKIHNYAFWFSDIIQILCRKDFCFHFMFMSLFDFILFYFLLFHLLATLVWFFSLILLIFTSLLRWYPLPREDHKWLYIKLMSNKKQNEWNFPRTLNYNFPCLVHIWGGIPP